MKKLHLIKLAMVLVGSLFIASTVTAEEVSKADQAVALVEKAAKFIDEVGLDKANLEFTKTEGPFVEGELYIFCIQFDGLMLGHGGNPKLVGKNIFTLKDPDGKLFIQDFTEVAKTKGTGWIDYKWRNTVSKQVEHKSSYIYRLKGQDIYIGCGIYK